MRTEADLIQNLKDAGCPEELSQQFMESYRSGRIKDGLRLLQQHRRALDYMVYHLEKEA